MVYHIKQSNGHNYTEQEKLLIKSAYESNVFRANGWLEQLSHEVKRSKSNISRYARTQGWTNRSRRSQDINCSQCGTAFHANTHTQRTCSVSCGILVVVRKRTGGHIWKDKPHPRGMLGKHHSEEFCKSMSQRVTLAWKDPTSKIRSVETLNKRFLSLSVTMVKKLKENPSSIYSRTIKGWKEFKDGKRYFFRSKWEMNYAAYLEWLKENGEIKDWFYEVKTFWFDKILRGVRSYTPDFEVHENDGSIVYHEVKGWMDKKSATKLKRMGIYHPKVKMVLIQEVEMKSIRQYSRLMEYWVD